MAEARNKGAAQEFVFHVAGPIEATARGQRVAVAAQRAGAAPQTLRAVAGRDIVELRIADGPTLRLHPSHAALLLQSQQGVLPRGKRRDEIDRSVVEVPAQLAFSDPAGPEGTATRGLLGRVLLEAIEVVVGPVRQAAAEAAARLAAAKLEAKTQPGVHALPPGPNGLPSFVGKVPLGAIPPHGERPILVFVHGTFSNLSGSFAPLWQQHPGLVERLFKAYGGAVYGLDHHTVTDNPFANALMLLDALPAGARVHLVTYSRGGLVGEVLARAMRMGRNGARRATAFDADDLALLKDPGYRRHREAIEALNRKMAEKSPRFERIVRVAGPARGTLLASGRLDAYLSVIEWGLSRAGVPVLPELIDFIGEVAREGTRPEGLEGLEAMMPGRPVMQVLTRPDVEVDSELRIVAGDVQADSVLSWLKVLLTDAFYLTDHDLVVNTNSMYGGLPRRQRPSFVLERGPQVSHFGYFSQPGSALAIVDGLIADAPARFRPVGALSWAGQSSEGVRGGRPAVKDEGNRPAVIVLPGIMGSHLMVNGKRVWADPLALFLGGLKKLAYPDAKVKAEEPIDRYFGDLMEDLAGSYDVIPFAFDWRAPIEESAGELAKRVESALKARAGLGKPVRLLAHSMGGLVVRALELVAPATWQALLAQPGARIVLAGTPNRGAYSPLLALSGLHPLVNGVEALDACTSWKELKAILGNFPGLLQLQYRDAEFDLTRRETWKDLEAHHAAAPLPPEAWHESGHIEARRPWGLPTQDALDRLKGLRDRLDPLLPNYRRLGNKLVLVAGSAAQTIAGLRKGRFGIELLATEAGDGTVPWESLRLPGVATWRAAAEHGDLLNEPSIFEAYHDLLETGTTARLEALDAGGPRSAAAAPAAREASLQAWRPARAPYAPTLGDVEAAALGAAGTARAAAGAALEADELPLRVEVVHGNLKYVGEPLLVGHYRADVLTGSERFLDLWLEGDLKTALQLGDYPQAVGEQRVFVNRRGQRMRRGSLAVPKPEAVIVAGLGDEDDLSAVQLQGLVAKAVIAWARYRVVHGANQPATLDLAAVLLGSGGIRIEIGESALAVVGGVREANRKLLAEHLPPIGKLELVELYGDRASIAHTSLGDAQAQIPQMRLEPRVKAGQGGRPRPVERGYRGTDHDRVHVSSTGPGRDELQFMMHSRRARGELRAQSTQRQLVDRLAADAAREPFYDASLAHALFNMLVPLALRPALTAASSVQLSLDADAARLPWEMLDDRDALDHQQAGEEPLALRLSMLRELRVPVFRERPVDNRAELNVLVIGEPQCPPERYARLPGAEREARAVVEQLRAGRGLQPVELMHPDARQVLKRLHERPWRMIHIAGHGDFDDENTKGERYGGVVLDKGYLGAKEIQGLPTVPELVFVNCCHVGRIVEVPAQPHHKPAAPGFAASIAEELIRIGVRCVVAAGWAVDDAGASAFASAFYAELLKGRSFARAVLVARQAAWQAHSQGTTWAAYQCYGDPGWTLRGLPGAASSPAGTEWLWATPTREDVLAALSEIEFDARDGIDDAARERTERRLRAFDVREGPSWRHDGQVAERFGDAWAAVAELDEAIAWYERARQAPDARATLRCAEQLINLRVRRTVAREDRAAIHAALAELEPLIRERPTPERWALRGSAAKRLAILALQQGPRGLRQEAIEHLAAMTAAYQEASRIAYERADRRNFYAPIQWAGGLALSALIEGRGVAAPEFAFAIEMATRAAEAADRESPDFFSLLAPAELRLVQALAADSLAADADTIRAEFAFVHERDSEPKHWASVRDNLTLMALALRAGARPRRAADALDRLIALVEPWTHADPAV